LVLTFARHVPSAGKPHDFTAAHLTRFMATPMNYSLSHAGRAVANGTGALIGPVFRIAVMPSQEASLRWSKLSWRPLVKSEMPCFWHLQFQIGEEVKRGGTETSIEPLAMRRAQLRIDRALKDTE